MRRAAVVLGVLSIILWGFAGLATWAGLDRGALSIEANAAAAATSLMGACLIAWAMRDRDKDVLVTAMADFTLRRGSAPTRPEVRLTRPEYRLHVVNGARLQ